MNSTKIKYIGHSAFYFETGSHGILVDPFISNNPVAKFNYKEEIITDIFLTHAHADHMGDAIPISRATKPLSPLYLN